MRPLHRPPREDLKLVSVYHALSDPSRLMMVKQLLQEPNISCTLIAPDMPKSTRSHHMRILREAGLTMTDIIGTTHYTRIRTDDLEARFPGLLQSIIDSNGDLF